MKTRSWATLVAFGVLALAALLINRSAAQSGTLIPVHIHSNGEVDGEIVNVRKSAGDQIVWYSDGGDFTVTFNVTPFSQATFQVPSGGSVGSGALKSTAAIGQYSYLVSSNSGGGGMDPGVNVKP